MRNSSASKGERCVSLQAVVARTECTTVHLESVPWPPTKGNRRLEYPVRFSVKNWDNLSVASSEVLEGSDNRAIEIRVGIGCRERVGLHGKFYPHSISWILRLWGYVAWDEAGNNPTNVVIGSAHITKMAVGGWMWGWTPRLPAVPSSLWHDVLRWHKIVQSQWHRSLTTFVTATGVLGLISNGCHIPDKLWLSP